MSEQELTGRFCRYFRASLADTARLSPDTKKLKNDHAISLAQFRQGKVPLKLAQALLKSEGNEEEHRRATEILVLPLVFDRIIEDGIRRASSTSPERAIPVCIRATLLLSGDLRPDQQGSPPALTRDLLEPNESLVTIGSVADADQFYQTQPEEMETWDAVVKYVEDLLREVCHQTLDDFEIAGYERAASVYLISNPTSSAYYAISLYDRFLENPVETPLLNRILEGCNELPLYSLSEQIEAHRLHLGQMNNGYGLSVSQREAMAHFQLSENSGHLVMAINGPPGTGKTTLLQSLVATLWVKAAMERNPCPVIVAASTNNQAVTNIIDSFSTVDDTGPYRGRWLPGLKSYGMYMPSEEAANNDRNKSRQLYGKPKNHFMARAEEDEEKWKNLAGAFLESFGRACPQVQVVADSAIDKIKDNVRNAQEHLHQLMLGYHQHLGVLDAFLNLIRLEGIQELSLKSHEQALAMLGESVAKISQETAEREQTVATATRVLTEWNNYILRESFWLELLSFIPAIRTYRVRRDEAILSQIHLANPTTLPESVRTRRDMDEFKKGPISEINEALKISHEALRQAQVRYQSYKDALAPLTQWCSQYGCEPSLDGINTLLDQNIRYTLFKLATHYWEADYLLEMAERLRLGQTDNLSPVKLAALFRRLAKLAPCFVSTFYMLPRHFTGSLDLTWQPLFNSIDLLIVDEAGQVLPDIAIASFTLANRAVVVGDVQQISPVWNLTTALDRSNALRVGLLADRSQYEPLLETKGFASASGNLMRVAQNACPFTKFSDVSRGLFLSEHRRCVPEIIDYCNVLLYKNRLEAKRPSKTDRILPALGYAHINGYDRNVSGSRRNETEAHVIAQWLAKNRDRLIEHYQGASLEDIVAIITPFAAQRDCLRQQLVAAIGPNKLTVGTIHALQGAERPIIIFSPTYGSDHKGGTFFGRDETMLNVAVSRAKDSFLVFGNAGLFDGQSQRSSSLLGKYLFSSPENEIVNIEPTWPEPTTKPQGLQLVDTLDGHRRILQQALQEAVQQVVIFSPYITVAALKADQIPEIIWEATQRGVSALIVTDPRLNSPKQTEFEQCLENLISAGAQVILAKRGMHRKELCQDDYLYVCGSFNWLSAVRSEDSIYHRQEASLACCPPDAGRLIKRALERIEELK